MNFKFLTLLSVGIIAQGCTSSPIMNSPTVVMSSPQSSEYDYSTSPIPHEVSSTTSSQDEYRDEIKVMLGSPPSSQEQTTSEETAKNFNLLPLLTRIMDKPQFIKM